MWDLCQDFRWRFTTDLGCVPLNSLARELSQIAHTIEEHGAFVTLRDWWLH
jgi:hypothetical protein